MMCLKTALSVLLTAYLLGQATDRAFAQDILSLPKHHVEINIDGIVNEPVWDLISPLAITQKVPVAGAPPSQPTEIRILYDEDYLYVSGRLFDDDPAKIIANTKRRDDFTENTEWFGLLIDTYNDRDNALAFYVTPTGAKLDMAISNDAQGTNSISTSWDAYWDAATTRNEQGWFAEIRIPFASLPFSVQDTTVIMGITTWRYFARNDETDIFPPRGLSTGSSFRPSLTQRFLFHGIRQRNTIQVTPYVLAGVSEAKQQPSTGADDAFTREVGLDTRIGLGGNVTLDLTLNTDFAQVENDDLQTNFTRSPLFFPERRLFFQERASLFDFTFGPFDKLFHSRQIGIVNGELTRIYGGLRAVGKFGRWEAGMLTMQTGARGPRASENFGVFRVIRQIGTSNSKVGAMLTNRTDLRGTYNTVYGLDATLRVVASNYLSLRWAQSFEDETSHGFGAPASTKWFAELVKRSPLGFTYSASLGRTGRDYEPGMGFEHREDFTQLNYRMAYNFFPPETSRLVQFGPYVTGTTTWSNTTHTLESRNVQLGMQWFAKSGWSTDLRVQTDRERLMYALNLPGGAVVEPGAYDFVSGVASLTSSSAKRIAYVLSIEAGGFYDGTRLSAALAPFINLTPDLSLEGSYAFNRLHLATPSQPVHVHLWRAKMTYTASTSLTFSGAVQRNSATGTTVGSARIRYRHRDRNELFLVYDGIEALGASEALGIPPQQSHTIKLKYRHTFR